MPRTFSICESTRYSANLSIDAARDGVGCVDRFNVMDIAAGPNPLYAERYWVGRTCPV